MDEFALIRKFLAPLAGEGGLGLLDDAAIYTPPTGFDLVLTKDSFVEGVHFGNGRYGGDTAERLLRTNLSDLAAKGARPVGYLLSIAWPKSADIKFFEGFAKGLSDTQDSFDFKLFGGDTVATHGPMVLSASFFGLVPTGQMVKRSGAKAGDDVWVSGELGAAMLGCRLITGAAIKPSPDGAALWDFETAYLRPEPRLLFRKLLRKYASASADISDGLLSDAGHICRASNVAMELKFDSFPVNASARQWALAQASPQDALKELLSFGDDYELVFTAPQESRAALRDQSTALGLKITHIGKVCALKLDQNKTARVSCIGKDGQGIEFTQTGYKHKL